MINILPVDLISAPNDWAPLKVSFWDITGGVASSIAGLLQTVDSLGTRPYVPAVGATLQAVFQRGEAVAGNTQVLTVTKSAAFDTSFRSLFTISLTAPEASNIISGTILWTLTEGVNQTKWAQNWAIRKLNIMPGF